MILFIYALLFMFSPADVVSDDFIWDGEAGDGLWMTAENWDNNILPEIDGDVIINDAFTVTFNATNYSVESLNLSGGASLIIPEGNTLNTSKGGALGSDGLHLEGIAGFITSLHLHGTLNISMADAPGDAVDINAYGLVHVYPNGLLNILESGSQGIEITESLINEGTINISNTSSSGIKTKGNAMASGMIHNMTSGQINLTDIPGKAINMLGSIPFVNDGVINIIGEDDVVFFSNEETFINNGVFNSSGTINAELFENGVSSTVAVSGPIGRLNFDGATTFPNNMLSITIDGNIAGEYYDQVQQIDGMMSLENTTLELLGSYLPQATDTLLIINTHSPDSSSLTGHFLDLPESASITFNGITLYISYNSGDGNDVVLLKNPSGSTDLDGDGFYSHVDCDDMNAGVFPGAVEIPNNDIDENCDNYIAMDQDFDGFFDNIDCDDENPNAFPGNPEIPYNGFDDDCDQITLDDDLDQDGQPIASDCDDNNPNVFSGNMETPYNGIDDDCDELTFDDDLDQDGFLNADDCNDEDPAINPAAEEIANNGIDENCDGEDLIVSNKIITKQEVKIFPNPTTGFLSIILPDLTNATLQLKDCTGKIIASQRISQKYVLDLSSLANGVYILFIQTREHSQMELIVKT